MGGQGLQEGAFWHGFEGQSLRRRLSRQRHRAGEDRSRGQAAQLRHQEVRQSTTHQERQEDHRFRSQGQSLDDWIDDWIDN